MSRNVNFAQNEYYHLYNRGSDKRKIFNDNNDYWRFMSLLYLANNTDPIHFQNQNKTFKELLEIETGGNRLVDIGAYCLMPNHFHILVRAIDDTGVSKFMQKLQTAYTMYFNRKHDRSGVLFQGKFKARHAMTDYHLKYLHSYIHLNPVKLIEPKWKETGITNSSKTLVYLEN